MSTARSASAATTTISKGMDAHQQTTAIEGREPAVSSPHSYAAASTNSKGVHAYQNKEAFEEYVRPQDTSVDYCPGILTIVLTGVDDNPDVEELFQLDVELMRQLQVNAVNVFGGNLENAGESISKEVRNEALQNADVNIEDCQNWLTVECSTQKNASALSGGQSGRPQLHSFFAINGSTAPSLKAIQNLLITLIKSRYTECFFLYGGHASSNGDWRVTFDSGDLSGYLSVQEVTDLLSQKRPGPKLWLIANCCNSHLWNNQQKLKSRNTVWAFGTTTEGEPILPGGGFQSLCSRAADTNSTDFCFWYALVHSYFHLDLSAWPSITDEVITRVAKQGWESITEQAKKLLASPELKNMLPGHVLAFPGRSGAATLLFCGGGTVVLFDSSFKDVMRSHILPTVLALSDLSKVNHLVMVISHSDADHIGGAIEVGKYLTELNGRKIEVECIFNCHPDEKAKKVKASDEVENTSAAADSSSSSSTPPSAGESPTAAQSVVAALGSRSIDQVAKLLNCLNPQDFYAGNTLLYNEDMVSIKCLHPPPSVVVKHSTEDSQQSGVRKQYSAKEFHGKKANDVSICSLVTIMLAGMAPKFMLFTGDADGDVILKILNDASVGKLHLFEVPHHGSKSQYYNTNAMTKFYQSVQADHYLMSGFGKNDHPSLEVIVSIALQQPAAQIWPTYEQPKLEIARRALATCNLAERLKIGAAPPGEKTTEGKKLKTWKDDRTYALCFPPLAEFLADGWPVILGLSRALAIEDSLKDRVSEKLQVIAHSCIDEGVDDLILKVQAKTFVSIPLDPPESESASSSSAGAASSSGPSAVSPSSAGAASSRGASAASLPRVSETKMHEAPDASSREN